MEMISARMRRSVVQSVVCVWALRQVYNSRMSRERGRDGIEANWRARANARLLWRRSQCRGRQDRSGLRDDRRSGHAAGQVTHAGQTYYFCSRHCVAKFQADPERYLRRSRETPCGGQRRQARNTPARCTRRSCKTVPARAPSAAWPWSRCSRRWKKDRIRNWSTCSGDSGSARPWRCRSF